jgi:uncharacterized protein
MMKDLVSYFVKTIVSQPEKIAVSEIETAGKRSIVISVAQEDRGRVIGKDGKTIRAIRNCVESVFPEAQDIIIDLVPQKES